MISVFDKSFWLTYWISMSHGYKILHVTYDYQWLKLETTSSSKRMPSVPIFECLQVVTRFFYIKTSKFCRVSLFLILWLLQPQFVLSFVLNFVLISVSGLKWEIKTKRQGIQKQCWSSVSVRTSLYIYPKLLPTVYFVLSRSPRPQVAEVNSFVAQQFYKI